MLPKKFSRREFLRIASAAGGAAALAASGVPQVFAAPGAQATIALEIVGFSLDDVHQQALDLFAKAHPEIQVTWTPVPGGWPEMLAKMNTRIAAGDPPDMVAVATYGPPLNWSKTGLLTDLSTYVANDADFANKPIPQALLDLYTSESKLFGIPKDYVSHAVIYNKAIFEAAGVEPPQDGWTWADVVEKAKALTSGDGADKIYGWMTPTGPWEFEQYMWANDGPGFFDRKKGDFTTPTANDPKNVEALKWLVDTILVDGISPSAEQLAALDAGTRQLSGKMAMWSSSTIDTVALLQAGDKIDWQVVPMPRAYKGGPLANVLWTSGFGMVSSTKHPDEVWTFLKHMSVGDGARVLGSTGFSIPAGVPDAFLSDAMKAHGGQIFVDATHADIVYTDGLGINHDELLNQVIVPDSQAAFLGQASPSDALDQIQQGMEDVLANNS
ncbi:MAG TPA: sugar ABC transporter substrate-binding protein [Phototrophicaceae bacterium]|nr:sugar ABC transporter substrate-binding protein [Phototrophicaceae bacterium]